VQRTIEFLAPLQLSLLTQRRGPYPPYGMDGGQPGALGSNLLRRADGALDTLPGQVQVAVRVGDSLTIETPGGGGWGNVRVTTTPDIKD
jgi:N-methylhydantoinase B/oxoprolinase/acetone carboxylase alpha subunit